VFDSEAAEREVGTTVFWRTGSADPQATTAGFLEQFQIRRDGGRRGIGGGNVVIQHEHE